MSNHHYKCVIEPGTTLPDIINIAEGMGINVENVLARSICDHGRWKELQDTLAMRIANAIGDNNWILYDWNDHHGEAIAIEIHNHPCEIDSVDICNQTNTPGLTSEVEDIYYTLLQFNLNVDIDPLLKNTLIIRDPFFGLLADLRDIKHLRHVL